MQHYNQPGYELGGDIARPLAGGAIKLVALATRRHRNYTDLYTGGPPVLGGFRQVQIARQGETIGRVSWTRSNLAGFAVEGGIETAYNSLDNHLTFWSSIGTAVKLPSTCRSTMQPSRRSAPRDTCRSVAR